MLKLLKTFFFISKSLHIKEKKTNLHILNEVSFQLIFINDSLFYFFFDYTCLLLLFLD